MAFGQIEIFGGSAIKVIKIRSKIPPIVKGDDINTRRECFYKDVYGNATLYVPEGSREAYEAHEVWGQFMNIETFDPNASIDEIMSGDVDCEVYTIGGLKVGNSLDGLPKGIYIVRKSSKVTKIVI